MPICLMIDKDTVMVENILFILHNATTFLYGIFLSAAFLGIKKTLKNGLIFTAFSALIGALFIGITVNFGEVVMTKVYPCVIHLPLILFFAFAYKKNWFASMFSVFTVYLTCQISKWIGLLAFEIWNEDWIYYLVRTIVTAVAFFIFVRFVSPFFAKLMEQPVKSLIILSIMPVTYYLFDYGTQVYTSLLYSGKAIVAEFLGFVLSVVFILFIAIYVRRYMESIEAEQKANITEMIHNSSIKEIESMRKSEQEIRIIRHDMRHFLTMISGYIEAGNDQKALERIGEVLEKVEATSVQKYSKNELVNMIMSTYSKRFKDNSVSFSHNIRIPEQLPVSEIDFTSVLSNALENAFNSVMKLPAEKRNVIVGLGMTDDKILMEVKNTFAEAPVFSDGIPKATKQNHGFGTQSIRYITERLNGNCQFSVKDDLFVVRVIL